MQLMRLLIVEDEPKMLEFLRQGLTETGSTTLAVEFDVEGGVELFEVEMDDGTDVKVAASDGTILGIEQRDAN